MQRPDQLVSQIHDAISRVDGQVLPQGSDELARHYADAVRQVNESLSGYVTVLREGLRSEALHWAELAPPVLEQAARLDFPDLPDWVELCQRNGFDAPPEINATAAIELDDAFQQEHRLQEALSRHRRLALMRAPLSARLKILRRLRQMDLDNPLWAQDLIELEKVRQKQILVEARTADVKADAQALQALLDEVRSPWEQEIPEQLEQDIERLLNKHRAAQAAESINQVVQSLSLALHQSNDSEIKNKLGEYQKLAATLGHTTHPDVVAQAQQHTSLQLKKQAEQRDHEQAIAAITLALNSDSAPQIIQSQINTLERQGHPVPNDLKQQVAERHEAINAVNERKKRTVLLAAVAALGIAGGIGAALWWQQQQTKQSNQAFTKLTELISENNHDAAWTEFQTLQTNPGSWLKQSRFMDIERSLDDWKKQDTERAARFQASIKRLQDRVAASIGPTELAALARDARTADENKTLEELRQNVSIALKQGAAERDTQIQQAIEELDTRHASLTQELPLLQWHTPVLGMQETLTAYADVDGISPGTQHKISNLQTKLAASLSQSQQASANRAATDQTLDRLARLVNKPLDFFGQIGADLQDPVVRETPLAQSLRRVAHTSRYVADAVAWRKTLSAIQAVEPKNAQQATQSLSAINAYLRAYPNGHFAQAAADYGSYLRQAQIALNPDNAVTATSGDIALLLRSPIIGSLNKIPLKFGGFWYTISEDPGQPTFAGKRIYRVFDNPKDALRGVLVDRTLNDKDVITPYEPSPAAITKFSQNAWQLLKDNPDRWIDIHTLLLIELMATQGVDPIHKVAVAKEIASIASERDWPNNPAMNRWRRQLSTVDTSVNWLNPKDNAAKTQRDKAISVLNEAPDWESARVKNQALWEKLNDAMIDFTPVGILDQSSPSDTVSSRPIPVDILLQTPDQKADLWSVRPSPKEPGGWTQETVGTLRNGQLTWLPSHQNHPTGTLLFWQLATDPIAR